MFIEVQRITTTGRGTENEKPLIQLETININTIHAFRHWHVGKKQADPGYDMTILIMEQPKSNKQEEINEDNYMNRDSIVNKKSAPTIMIKEKYELFRDRLATKVQLRVLDASN